MPIGRSFISQLKMISHLRVSSSETTIPTHTEMAEPFSDTFVSEEERVERESSVFKKELGLTDLVLTQILFIVGLPWVGVAAKQGPSHVVLWLTAIVLFYIPSAVTVI